MNPFLRGAKRERPLIVGHRGAMGLAPENTLESFELAFDLGADMVELDVHVTRDGKLVVIHDDLLDRTTTLEGWVSDATLAEIRAADAGRWFVGAVERKLLPPHLAATSEERARYPHARYATGVHPPSLEEVLDLVKRRGKTVNVELKMIPRFYAELVPLTIDLVRRKAMEDQVVLSSFDHQAIQRAKRLAPEIAGNALEVSRLASPGRYVATVLDADGWNPGCILDADTIGFGSVTGALDAASVHEAHEHGVQVHVWTENDPERLAALARLGVDGIITDFPNRLVKVLNG